MMHSLKIKKNLVNSEKQNFFMATFLSLVVQTANTTVHCMLLLNDLTVHLQTFAFVGFSV